MNDKNCIRIEGITHIMRDTKLVPAIAISFIDDDNINTDGIIIVNRESIDVYRYYYNTFEYKTVYNYKIQLPEDGNYFKFTEYLGNALQNMIAIIPGYYFEGNQVSFNDINYVIVRYYDFFNR
jgi:hypothetical protein